MRSLLLSAALLSFAASFVGVGRLDAEPVSRPNLLSILADDRGIGDVSSRNPTIPRRPGRKWTGRESSEGNEG